MREAELSKSAFPVVPTLSIHTAHVVLSSRNSMTLSITLSSEVGKMDTEALINTGAGGSFIDHNFAQNKKLRVEKLTEPIKVLNVDGTENKTGRITSYTNQFCEIAGKHTLTRFYISGLGKKTVILGYPWMIKHNPIIDWSTATLSWNNTLTKFSTPKPTIEEVKDEDDGILL
jgi:hypothetical protein